MGPNWVGLCLCPEIKFQLIRHFIQNPELRQNQTQLAKSLRIPGISVSRHIRDLVKLRILHEERHGRSAIYSLNKASEIVNGFLSRIVALNDNLLVDWVKTRLKSCPSHLKKHIERIILFGSAARGEMKPTSDIDLLIVVSRESKQLEAELRANLIGNGHEVGFTINLHIEPLSKLDLSKTRPFLRSARSEGITVWRR